MDPEAAESPISDFGFEHREHVPMAGSASPLPWTSSPEGPIRFPASAKTGNTGRRAINDLPTPSSPTSSYDSEDDENDGSIHHGENEDEETIAVASVERSPQVLSGSFHDSSTSNNAPPGDRVLPDHLNDQLESWYEVHGRALPECVVNFTPKYMLSLWKWARQDLPVQWLHRSGASLEATWYHLPGQTTSPTNVRSPKVIVVSGPGVAPCIVNYLNSGGQIDGIREIGVVYKIWLGIGGDMDGWETSPSVIKISKSAPNAISRTGRLGNVNILDDVDGVSSLRNYNYRKRPNSADDEALGTAHNLQLRHSVGGDTRRSKRTKLARSSLQNEHLFTSIGLSESSKRSALNKAPTTTLATTNGVRYGCYLCPVTRTTVANIRQHLRKAHKVRDINEDYINRPIENITATEKAGGGAVTNFRNNKISPATVRPSMIRASSPPTIVSMADLEAYVLSKARVVFAPSSYKPGQAQRVRSLFACDTVHKMFAQAAAGGVFSRSNGRVLELEVEDRRGQRIELPVVEEDVEDFNAAMAVIKQSRCWTISTHGIDGAATINVREWKK